MRLARGLAWGTAMLDKAGAGAAVLSVGASSAVIMKLTRSSSSELASEPAYFHSRCLASQASSVLFPSYRGTANGSSTREINNAHWSTKTWLKRRCRLTLELAQVLAESLNKVVLVHALRRRLESKINKVTLTASWHLRSLHNLGLKRLCEPRVS